jgi:hypothetical protein
VKGEALGFLAGLLGGFVAFVGVYYAVRPRLLVEIERQVPRALVNELPADAGPLVDAARVPLIAATIGVGVRRAFEGVLP